ncbi:MAG TPA: DUF1232 domain-containing protein [Pyrinomonadaceae bacterium]|nr:DUF1232 domain-containing protein [Pyrinomonadaceae bacterium]
MELEARLNEDSLVNDERRRDWSRHGRRLQREIYMVFLMFKHPLMPWYAKAAAALPIAYHLSPIQVIPPFIPVVGMLDDLLFMLLGMKLVYRLTPVTVLAECRSRAAAAEAENEEEMKRFALVFAAILIACWLLSLAIGVSLWAVSRQGLSIG